MEHEFWHERWKNREIGFHRQDVHPLLTQHIHEVASPKACIFVPLCGKSRDMHWLVAHGYQVLGIELNQSAVTEFFAEHNLQPSVHNEGPFRVYRAPGITLYQGDFFALGPTHLHGVSAWYDRAAMVALPSTMRTQYAQHLQHILPPHTHGLLVAVEYPENYWKGPPFAIFSEEIAQTYAQHYAITELPLIKGFSLGGDPNVIERGYVLKHK